MTEPSTKDQVRKEFLEHVKDHVMTVVRDDGINRHLRFQKGDSSVFWFDIITWDGCLCIRGDCGTYLFSRIPDMFQFFRMDKQDFNYSKDSPLQINTAYWREKCIAEDPASGTLEFTETYFRQYIETHFNDYYDGPENERASVWAAIEEDVLRAENEYEAHEKLRDFSFKGFEFGDSWEYHLKTYTYHYLWCCYAIAWAIQKYDNSKL